MIHNEDSRVKIPAILHLTRLGYPADAHERPGAGHRMKTIVRISPGNLDCGSLLPLWDSQPAAHPGQQAGSGKAAAGCTQSMSPMLMNGQVREG
jgi:hypothetical protein